MTGANRFLRVAAGLVLALGAAACADTNRAADARCRGESPRRALVFWDRSISTRGDAATQREFMQSLGTLVHETLRCPGDEVAGFLVHGRTRGKAYSVAVRHDLTLPETRGSRNQVARDSLRYAAALQELREDGRRRFRVLVDSAAVAPRLAGRTDLLGTIEVISEELASAPADASTRVYYFSDMHESMTGPGRRDFDREPPSDRAEAEAWARADAELVRRQMNVEPERFEDVEIRVSLEGHGNRPATDAVKFYWLTLFEEVGFSRGRVRYNRGRAE